MGRFLMPSLTKFKPEAEKDQFERMADFYMSRYSSEFKSIIEDGVEYDYLAKVIAVIPTRTVITITPA